MVDLVIVATNVVAGDNATVKEGYLAGETITAGAMVVRNSSTGKLVKADNNSATAELKTPLGIALNGGAINQPIDVQTEGDVTIGALMTAGTTYYLSDTPGGICPIADVIATESPVIVGIAESASVLHLAITPSGVTL